MAIPLRVLILEDRPEDAELMVHQLRDFGFKLDWERVDTEADYVTRLGTVPDVILADHTLPEFSAPEALESLKKTGLDIPFIVVTGSISEEAAVERMKQGAADYILKDRMKRLGPAVLRTLEQKKLRNEKRRAAEEIERNLQRMRALHEIDLAITSSLNLPTILNLLLGKIDDLLPHSATLVRLRNKETGTLDIVASRNVDEAAFSGLRHKTGLGLTTKVMRDRVPAMILNAQTDPRVKYPEFFRQHGLVSYLVVPLVAKDEVLGLLTFFSREQHEFTPEETEFTYTLASRAAIAIYNSLLYQETKNSLERVKVLNTTASALNSTLEQQAILDFLLEKLELFLPAGTAITVRLLKDGSHELELVAFRNLISESPSSLTRWGGWSTVAQQIIETKVPVFVRNVQTDPRIKDPEFFRQRGVFSYAGFPLVDESEVIGLLALYMKEERELPREEIEFLFALAAQAATAIHNARLYEQMAQANKVKDEFLSVISHELRTPLNVVMGYTAMIKDGMLGPVDPKQEEALAKILSRGNDQLAIINNILYATVLEANKLHAEKQVVVLPELFAELESSYFALTTGKDLKIMWDCPEGFSVIETDRGKLRHILQNLIDNAIKFTEKGSVTTSVTIDEKSKTAQFQVSDTGVGIAPEAMPHIFDKFYQVDSSETRLYGGVGIGLHIVQRFTEIMGGKVTVKSQVGSGSTFTVSLPLA